MREERSFAASISIDGRMFAIGGYSDRFGTELSSVEAIDLSNEGEWAIQGSMEMPEPREKHCAVVINGQILVIGGVGIDSVIAFEMSKV